MCALVRETARELHYAQSDIKLFKQDALVSGGRTERRTEFWWVNPKDRRPGFDPGSIHVGIVVDKVSLGQVFPQVLRFSPVNYIPPVLHYKEKGKKKTNHLHHWVAQ
jgi:hypothetical protein